MGTNYYWIKETNKCKHCNRSDVEKLHIGKSSVGWYFSLHIIPEEDIENLSDWYKRFMNSESYIEDEYGQLILPNKMLDIIRNRGRLNSNVMTKDAIEQFCRENHAVEGLNGLFRSKVDGSHCIGHGAGTWDYITGEFC